MSYALRTAPAPEVHGVPAGTPLPPAPTAGSPHPHVTVRSTEMHTLYEELARAHSQRLLDEAVHERRVSRHVRALRAQRRAERAAHRARRMLALAVLR